MIDNDLESVGIIDIKNELIKIALYAAMTTDVFHGNP